jgi:hypothetical protein
MLSTCVREAGSGGELYWKRWLFAPNLVSPGLSDGIAYGAQDRKKETNRPVKQAREGTTSSVHIGKEKRKDASGNVR